MEMFGVTQEPLLQEYWEGQPIKELLDPALNKRGAEQFRSKISSVIFIPKISIEFFVKSYIVFNIYRHLALLARQNFTICRQDCQILPGTKWNIFKKVCLSDCYS